MTFVWNIADTLNGLMAIPNFIALFALSPVIFKITREYFRGVDLASAKHDKKATSRLHRRRDVLYEGESVD